MRNPRRSQPRGRTAPAFRALTPLLAASAGLFLLQAFPADPADAGVVGQGPVWTVGVSPKTTKGPPSQEVEPVTFQAGWRWRLSGPSGLDATMRGAGIDASLVVEPLVGIGAGDRSYFEMQAVPMFRAEPERKSGWRPYIEAGVGLVYIDVTGFDLGSNVLFSDQFGIGFSGPAVAGRRVGVGYRIRHISHAGLWADNNSGLNTHFLSLTVE